MKLASFFSLRLKARLILTVLAASILSIVVLSGAMLWIARFQAEATVQRELNSDLALRSGALTRYLESVESDLVFLTSNLTTAEALFTFTYNYAKAGPDALRDAYIADNPHPVGEKHKLTQAASTSEEITGYNVFHGRYHQGMRAFLEERGYYDIFLISTDGDLVYSVFKELDFATNLRNGPYADSGLGKAWRAAMSLPRGEIAFEDFEPYEPSFDAPASFLATPVYGAPGTAEETTLKGILAVQLPIERISAEISAGSTGPAYDAFVFGADGLLRSDSEITQGDDVLSTPFPQGLEALDAPVEGRDLAGRDAVIEAAVVDAFGTPWYLAVTATQDSAYAGFAKQRNWALLSAVPVAFMALVMAWTSARSLARPVERLKDAASALSQGKRVQITGHERADELGELSRAMLDINDTAAAARRTETALSVSSFATAICDEEFNIIFVNKAMVETMRRSEGYLSQMSPGMTADDMVGASIDIFHKDPSHQRAMMSALRGAHKAEVTFGGHVAGLSVFPIDDEIGRIGYMVQWDDLTERRAAERMIGEMVDAAAIGDFSRRVALNSQDPFLIKMEEGLNQFFETVEAFMADLDQSLTDFADGDLRVELVGSYQGTLGNIADRVHSTAAALHEVIGKVKETGHAISQSSLEISSDANDLAQRTESQAASIEETAASMEEISATVKENAENSAVADARAAEATELAEKGREVVAHTVAAMAAIRESASQISEVTSIIESLAFETHLLSLNASVEAARAGDAGKGFGVVAAEVGSLARRSTDEAKAIKKLIQTSEMQVAEGDRLVGETDTALSDIIASVRTAAEMIKQIAQASSGQSKSIDEIAIAVAELDNMTQQNSQLAEKSSVGASVLTEQAEQMSEAVSIFVTGDDDPREIVQDTAWTSIRGRAAGTRMTGT